MARPKHTRQATTKQLTALKLINEIDPETGRPHSKRKAMTKAGYSKNVANNPKKLMDSQAIVTVLDQFHLQLKDNSVTTAYLAKKYKEWLDAQYELRDKKTGESLGITAPDYKTQLKAGEMLKDIYNLTPANNKKDDGVTRRITLEEFVSGD